MVFLDSPTAAPTPDPQTPRYCTPTRRNQPLAPSITSHRPARPPLSGTQCAYSGTPPDPGYHYPATSGHPRNRHTPPAQHPPRNTPPRKNTTSACDPNPRHRPLRAHRPHTPTITTEILPYSSPHVSQTSHLPISLPLASLTKETRGEQQTSPLPMCSPHSPNFNY